MFCYEFTSYFLFFFQYNITAIDNIFSLGVLNKNGKTFFKFIFPEKL